MIRLLIFIILCVDLSLCQNILPGGCSSVPLTNIIFPSFPSFGNGVNQYVNTSGLLRKNMAYEFLLADGVWCGSSSIYFSNTTTQINNMVMCSTQHFDGTTLSNTNLCGNTYYSTYNNTSTAPNVDQITMPYNMCPKINSTTGGIFPMLMSTSGTLFVRVARSYPSDIGNILSSLSTSSITPNAPIFTECTNNIFWTSSITGNIRSFIFDGVGAITAGATYSTGFLYIFFKAPDIYGLTILYNSSNNNLVIANMTQSSITVLDTILWPSTSTPQITGNELMGFLNTTSGYLYLVTTNTAPGNTPIFQINMTTYKFIKNQQITKTFRFATPTPFGVGNQLLIAFWQGGSQNLPSMWCIKDPYNPVLLSQLTIQNFNIFQTQYGFTSTLVPISLRVPLGRSSCFRNNEWAVNIAAASDRPVFFDYCGSGVYNNASYCNTPSSGSSFCCPQNCSISTSTVCGSPASICYSGDFCNSGNCSIGTSAANGTVCGSSETSCYTGDFCYSGNCSSGSNKPNTTLCSPGTSCTDPSYCNGTSPVCPANHPFPVGTVCGFPTSVCYTGDLCNSTGYCIIGHNEADSKICFNETSCIYSQNCSSGICPTLVDKPDFTVCGISPSICYSGDVCFAGNCIQGTPSLNTTSCSSSPSVCYDNGRCSGINQTCLSPLPFPNGTLCGPPSTSCLSAFLCYSGSCINGTNVPDGTPCGATSSTSCVTSGTCSSGTCTNSSTKPEGTLCGQNQSSTLCLTDPICNTSGTCIPSHPKPAGTICIPSPTISGICDAYGNCIITSSTNTSNITFIHLSSTFNAFISDNQLFSTFVIGFIPFLILLFILFRFNTNRDEKNT